MNYKNILSVCLLIVIVGVLSLLQQRPWQVLGNISAGEAMVGTTTPALANNTVLCASGGVIGSVDVVGAGTGALWLYDATTTNINLRLGNKSSTTIHKYQLPIGYATSTRALNMEFTTGLIVTYTTGVASTTITYRCGS